MKDSQEIFNYIDIHFDEHLELTRKFLKQPGVSLTEEHNPDVDRSAEMLVEILREAGVDDIQLFPLEGGPGRGGYPVVYGHLRSKNPNAKTLVFYCLYDMMPADEPEWIVPPHSATIMNADENALPSEWGKIVVARAARNHRGPLMGVINAIKSILAVRGDIPINIIFAIEGEEELMSINYHQFVEKHLDELRKADGAFGTNFGQVGPAGDHCFWLGVKGIIGLELKVEGGDWGGPSKRDLFAADEAWVDAPAWKLVWALNTLKSPNGGILIDGFYDDVRSLTNLEKRWIDEARENFNEEQRKSILEISQFKDGKPGETFLKDYYLGPILNIDGFKTGWMGPYIKTSLPRVASAKIDIRIVPDQDHVDITRKLRKHLDVRGFREVQIKKISGFNAVRTGYDEPLVKAAIKTTEMFGLKPIALPSGPSGCGARAILQGPNVGLPYVLVGLGRGDKFHAPNEYFTVEGLKLHEKWMAVFLNEYAKI